MLALAVLTCLVLYGLRNTKKAVWLLMFLIMSIPMGIIAPGINTVLIFRLGPISVFELAIIFYLLLLCIRHPLKTRRYLSIAGVLFVAYIICIIDSLFTNGFHSTFADAKDYLMAIALLFLVLQISDKYGLDDFCMLALKASFCANIVVLLGYIATYQTIFPSQYRFGFAVQALSIFTIPYIVYRIFIQKSHKKWMIAELFLQLYMMLISQNRTNPCIILVCITLMIIYYLSINRGVSKATKKRFLIFAAIFAILIIISAFYIKTHQDIGLGYLGRINEMLQGNFTTDSTEIRNINIAYYFTKIIEKPQGVGFGTYMPALSLYKTGFDDTTLKNYGFDNAYITLAYKAGIIIAVLYGLFLLQHLSWTFRQRKNDNIYFLCTLVLLGMGLSGSYFTIQLAKSINVYGFYMSFIIFLREKENYN